MQKCLTIVDGISNTEMIFNMCMSNDTFVNTRYRLK